MSQRPIYLDNNATTRVDPQVLDAMIPFLTEEFGNAGSRSHEYGTIAAAAVQRARQQVAALVGVESLDVVFTSGATESNNLALFGICTGDAGHVVTCATEHHAVLDPTGVLARRGWKVTRLTVGTDGRLSPDDVAAALQHDTRIVSLMWANNETGVIQDVPAIARICRERGILFHTDAVQAVGKIPLDLTTAGVDLLSVSAHKMYGPKGIGALVATRRARRQLLPLVHGGGQERGLRSGTLPVHQVVGFGAAAACAATAVAAGEPTRIRDLRDLLFERLAQLAGDVEINGRDAPRLPGTLNVWIRGCDTEGLLVRAKEVAFSTGSACTSDSMEPSHVLKAMFGDEQRARESARLSLGRFTTEEQVDLAAAALASHITAQRALGRISFAKD